MTEDEKIKLAFMDAVLSHIKARERKPWQGEAALNKILDEQMEELIANSQWRLSLPKE